MKTPKNMSEWKILILFPEYTSAIPGWDVYITSYVIQGLRYGSREGSNEISGVRLCQWIDAPCTLYWLRSNLLCISVHAKWELVYFSSGSSLHLKGIPFGS